MCCQISTVPVCSRHSDMVMPDMLSHDRRNFFSIFLYSKLFFTSQGFFFLSEILRVLHERTSQHILQENKHTRDLCVNEFVLMRGVALEEIWKAVTLLKHRRLKLQCQQFSRAENS